MRYTKLVTITAACRDKGKQFLVTELPADQGMRLVGRILLAFSRGGIEVSEEVFANGWAGLAAMMPYLLVAGLKSLTKAQWIEIEPLVDEMLTCIQFQPPGSNGDERLLQPIFSGANSQIEEIPTYFSMLKEVAQLHAGFSMADVLSTSGQPPSETPSA